jgi:ABC-type nitrate/sulfonate/bicarbonate transport system substrate-binding protein
VHGGCSAAVTNNGSGPLRSLIQENRAGNPLVYERVTMTERRGTTKFSRQLYSGAVTSRTPAGRRAVGSGPMGRRDVLRWGAALGAGTALSGVLAACSSSSSSSASAASADGQATVSYQLAWLPNVEFAGTYDAIKLGYFAAQKINVKILDGGTTVSTPSVVESGNAMIGTTGLDEAAQAYEQGADIKVVGLLYQKNPYIIESPQARPIKTPEDMYGKRIGVTTGNLVAWNAFLELNHLDASRITRVPTQGDMTPLYVGQVDGLMGFETNDPTQPQAIKFGLYTFPFEDYNYHLATTAYIVRSDTLTNQATRNQIVRFLRGELKGWQYSVAHPDLGAQLALSDWGSHLGLDLEQQEAQSVAQNKLIVDSWTEQHGIATFSAQTITASFKTLAASGINVKSSDLIDPTVISDVYQGKATL